MWKKNANIREIHTLYNPLTFWTKKEMLVIFRHKKTYIRVGIKIE